MAIKHYRGTNTTFWSHSVYITFSLFQIVFLAMACLCHSVSMMLFAHTSLRKIDYLTKNFWLMLGGTATSLIVMVAIETPIIPGSTQDILLCLNHVFSIAISTLMVTASVNYISAVHFSLCASLEVPLTLLCQVTFLTEYGKEVGGPLQIVGALIVFLAVFLRPLLQMYIFARPEDEK